MRKHMLNTAISIFDIFPYNVVMSTGIPALHKDSIYTMQGLEHSFVGISVPGFCYVYAFYSFTLRGSPLGL